MARPTFWIRGSGAYFSGGVQAQNHAVYIFTLTAGQTLTRTRLHWQASHVVATAASEAVGIPISVGAILVDAGTDPGLVPNPFANPDADWFYYEHEFFLPRTVENPDSSTYELDVAPSFPGERDNKAMRLAVTAQDVYFCAATDPAYFPQDLFYLSGGASILITDAA